MGKSVRDAMTENPRSIGASTSVVEAARLMREQDIGSLPITDDEQLVGMITDRDITCRAVARGRNPLELTAADCMTSPAVTVHPETSFQECCDALEGNQIRRVPVVDEAGRCVGIVSVADIARGASRRATGEVIQHVSKPAPSATIEP